MSVDHINNREMSKPTFGLQPYLLRFVAGIVMLLVIMPLLPGLISNIIYSFSGEAPKIYWYLSRSAGFVAITILWVSMVLGLGITNKMARLWPGAPAAFAIHEFVSLLGLGFAIYHGLVLIGDHYVDFSLPRLLTPFSIEYKTLWVGLGQIGFYLWLITTTSFYIRRFIGQKTWRLIHYTNFAIYAMGLLHGIYSGTDSSANLVRFFYGATLGILLGLLFSRVYDSALRKKDFSLSRVRQYWAQNFVPIPSRVRTAVTARLSKQFPSFVVPRRKADKPALPSDPIQRIEDKTQPQIAEEAAVENQAQLRSDAGSTNPATHAPEGETISPVLVEKFENQSGEDRVNVRIFREPAPKPAVPEPPKDEEPKPEHGDTPLARLRDDFHKTPAQPTASNQASKRIKLLDE